MVYFVLCPFGFDNQCSRVSRGHKGDLPVNGGMVRKQFGIPVAWVFIYTGLVRKHRYGRPGKRGEGSIDLIEAQILDINMVRWFVFNFCDFP